MVQAQARVAGPSRAARQASFPTVPVRGPVAATRTHPVPVAGLGGRLGPCRSPAPDRCPMHLALGSAGIALARRVAVELWTPPEPEASRPIRCPIRQVASTPQHAVPPRPRIAMAAQMAPRFLACGPAQASAPLWVLLPVLTQRRFVAALRPQRPRLAGSGPLPDRGPGGARHRQPFSAPCRPSFESPGACPVIQCRRRASGFQSAGRRPETAGSHDRAPAESATLRQKEKPAGGTGPSSGNLAVNLPHHVAAECCVHDAPRDSAEP